MLSKPITFLTDNNVLIASLITAMYELFLSIKSKNLSNTQEIQIFTS